MVISFFPLIDCSETIQMLDCNLIFRIFHFIKGNLIRKRTFFDQTFTGLPKVRRRKIQMLLECRRKVRGRIPVLHPDFRDAFFFFHLKQLRTSLKAHPLNELIESLIRIRFEHSHQMILGIRTMPGHIIHGDVFVDMLKYVIYRLIYTALCMVLVLASK